jgi:hypothetical protein
VKFIEAMKALLGGKKVRSKYWRKDQYLCLDSAGNLNEDNGPNCFDSCSASTDCELDGEWEYFQELDPMEVNPEHVY